jgi:AraC-like DNA-binding protein
MSFATSRRERLVLRSDNLIFPELHMLGRYRYANSQQGLAIHSHPGCIEICFLARGHQIYHVKHRNHVLRGGDVFITFPNEPHSTGGHPQEKGILYWLVMRLPKKTDRFLGLREGETDGLIQNLFQIPRRSFRGSSQLQRLLEELISIAENEDNSLKRISLGTKVIEFLLEIIRCEKEAPSKRVSPGIEKILNHIQNNLHRPLGLGELAREARLSPSRFKARFKAEVGIPPAEHVMRCKIEKAKRLLEQKGKSVTDTAFDLGFSSSQYFATAFKRYTRQNPKEFQRKDR